MNDLDWHAVAIEEVFHKLETSKEGLDESVVKRRLKQFGLNTLQIKSSETPLRMLLRQINNPLIYVLLLSCLIAYLFGKFVDASVILSVVILNTWIGFAQEYPASKVIRELSVMIPLKTTVMRKGKIQNIHSSHLVPGDIVYLQAGDKIAADLRLVETTHFQCDESILTGESQPVRKQTEVLSKESALADRKCMAYNGTYVTTGTAIGVVVATGLKTEFGKISELLEQVTPLATPLSRTLKKIASWITAGVIAVGLLLFLVGYLRNYQLFDSALAAVALAVAAIPEGLPAIITIASAIGVRRMAKKQAIIRQLPAVEALGSTSVICTDKTGTLTHNEMTVQKLWTVSGFSTVSGTGFSFEGEIVVPKEGSAKNEVEELIRASILCSDAVFEHLQNQWMPVGDPTEIALIVAGRKMHIEENAFRRQQPRQDSIPFDPAKRVMATLNICESNKKTIILKGAPEEVLQMCDIASHKLILQHVEIMAKEGLRVLAIAKKLVAFEIGSLKEQDLQAGFSLLGLVGMIDLPRKEVYEALKSCYKAGINIKMITGDHPLTAEVIGRDLGILAEGKVVTGLELDKFDEAQWSYAAKHYTVFARTTPEHKLKLVQLLQAADHVVAMTGDGVNDAPALKKADIGISMGIKGTEVAKEAADIVLADDNFASIEAAVEEGRRIYDNLVKALAFVFPTSLGQALIILFAVLFFPIHNKILLLPIQPAQILWVNLVVATALALPLAFEVAEPDIMAVPPRKKNSPIFSRFILIRTLTVALLMSLVTVGIFLWIYYSALADKAPEQLARSEAQTIAVTSVILFQIFYLFNCRSLKYSSYKIGFFSNPWVWFGTGIVLMAQVGFIYLPFMNTLFNSSPLSWKALLISTCVALTIFPFIFIQKFITKKASLNRWS